MNALVADAVISRAVVIGLFGGAGLALTIYYSRRGPLVYPVYAALFAALALHLSRYPALTFADRFSATLIGYMVASTIAMMLILYRNSNANEFMDGVDPADSARTRIVGYARVMSVSGVFVLVLGAVASAGVAFIAG